MNDLNKIICIVCFYSMEEERLADMVVEYAPTEMDITVCVTEVGLGRTHLQPDQYGAQI